MGWALRFFALAQNDKTTPLPPRSPKITLEKQIQQRFREARVIVNVFVEFEMAVVRTPVTGHLQRHPIRINLWRSNMIKVATSLIQSQKKTELKIVTLAQD